MQPSINTIVISVSPWVLDHGVKILAILLAVYIIRKFANIFIIKFVRKAVVGNNFSSKEAERQREDTLIQILSSSLRVLLWILGGLMVISELGVNIGPLLAGVGIAGIALGFGGQYLIRDLVTGIFIIFENQYRVGDVACFDETWGLVEGVTIRMTTLRDLDGVVHHVPHGEIKKVANLSKEFARVNLDIGISYASDLEHVIKIVNNVGKLLADDPKWKDSITKPPQFLRVNDFADSAIIIKILGETKPLKQWDVTGELRKRLKIAFDKEKIEIPFPQRVVHSEK